MKTYPEFDNELLYMVEENSEDATTTLINKYSKLISIVTNKYKSYLREFPIEYKDLYQEALLGFLEAVNTYDKTKDAKFQTYATTCMDNKLKSIFRHNITNKNKIQNYAISLDDFNKYSDNLHEAIPELKPTPEEQLIIKEQIKEINNKIKTILLPKEYKIYLLKLKGYKNDEIANLINKNKKYVENTSSRINKKLNVLKKTI